jgi:tetratricopeptide (TPR) repeat protein
MDGEMGGIPAQLWLVAVLAQAGFPELARQADAARDRKQLDRAVALYKQALVEKPDWAEGLWSLGSISYDLDRYTECSAAFGKLAALKHDSAPAWTMAGLCEYRLRRYDTALQCLEQAARLKFEEPLELAKTGKLHYALVLTKSGSFERAIAVLTDLTRVNGKSPEAIAAAGIAGLRRAWVPWEVPEGDRELVFQLGDAMATAMEFEAVDALRKFEELVARRPEEANVRFRFGAYLNAQGSDRGVEEIKKAVALAPDHLPALVGLATIFLKRQEPDEALGFAQRAVKAGESDFAARLILGRALLAKEDPRRAAAELEAAVKLAPASADARYSLASAYSRMGRKQDAARELAEFRRLQSATAQ